jgi:asparagine synthase (glutamine-hydrolysing)
MPLWQRLPAGLEQKSALRRLKRLVGALALPPETRYLTWIAYFTEEQKRSLYQGDLARATADLETADLFEARFREVAGRDPLTAATYVDLMTYLPDDLLVKVDVASMAHALECRSPFLDHKVVELAARMPIGLKLRGRQSKYLLKKTFADLLPNEILRRGKMGFGVPIARWFRGDLRGFLTDILLGPPARARGYFELPVVSQLVTEHVRGVFDHGYRLWALLWFELWCRMFLDAPPSLTPPAAAPL